MIPIFLELRPYLDAAWHASDPGKAVPMITRYRDAKQNLRTHFERIIQKAGLKAWPKLFQNLRSSRETELAEKFPIQVVVAWLGNSEPVAKKHYLQVTEDHFARALNEPKIGGAKRGEQASVLVGEGGKSPLNDLPGAFDKNPNSPELPEETQHCPPVPSVDAYLLSCSVGGTGLEPVTPSV